MTEAEQLALGTHVRVYDYRRTGLVVSVVPVTDFAAEPVVEVLPRRLRGVRISRKLALAKGLIASGPGSPRQSVATNRY